MEAVAAEPTEQATEAVQMSSPSETSAQMEEEANKKGYGKAYAAFGGGKEGLEACAASKSTQMFLSPAMQCVYSHHEVCNSLIWQVVVLLVSLVTVRFPCYSKLPLLQKL